MLIVKNGDLLKANENILCHQVNPDGYMGGGIAYAIARKYPNCLNEYANFCEEYDYDYELLKGKCIAVKVKENQAIANCFSQDPTFTTDYKALEEIFDNILEVAKRNNQSVAMPYKYGCGIARGNWDKVTKILEKLSKKHKIDIVIYKKEN